MSSSAPTVAAEGSAEDTGHEILAQCVTNVQRYSLHDGGGVRTVALLKGCPFRCPWCCNSENLSFAPEVSWKAKLCIGCSVRADGRRDANGCPCDTPSELCPTEAKELLGRMRTSESLAEELLRDRVFFEETVGGVTTNPSILAKSGRAPFEVLREIRDIIGPDMELHAQVIAKDAEGMVADAHRIVSELGENTFAKVPSAPQGFKAMKQLHAEGVKVTAPPWRPARDSGQHCVSLGGGLGLPSFLVLLARRPRRYTPPRRGARGRGGLNIIA